MDLDNIIPICGMVMDRFDEWSIFVAVATRRSFAEAARAIGRSPQVVTRAVASLERRLGTRLLHRTTRSVSLTDEGARHLERARPLLADLDALEAQAAPQGPLEGTLTLAAPVLFGRLHVAPVVHELLEENPRLDVRLLLHDRIVSLADEGIDVAVRIGPLADSSLRARYLRDVRVVVCASPDYLRRRGTPKTPDDLRDHDVIAFTATTPIPDRWSFRVEGKRERTVAVRPRLVVNTAEAAIDAAAAGFGITRVVSYQVATHLGDKRLRAVLTGDEAPHIPVSLVQLPGVQSRRVGAFVDLASKRLARSR